MPSQGCLCLLPDPAGAASTLARQESPRATETLQFRPCLNLSSLQPSSAAPAQPPQLSPAWLWALPPWEAALESAGAAADSRLFLLDQDCRVLPCCGGTSAVTELCCSASLPTNPTAGYTISLAQCFLPALQYFKKSFCREQKNVRQYFKSRLVAIFTDLQS